MIARVFVNDGNIESHENEFNYYYFNSCNKEIESQIKDILLNANMDHQQKRKLVKQLCIQSHTIKTNKINLFQKCANIFNLNH